MHKIKLISINLVLLSYIFLMNNCSKNPIAPLPPIEHKTKTFEEHLNRLATPGHVYFWIKNFTVYDSGRFIINEFGEGYNEFNQNWYNWREKGFSDQAYAVAYEMWNNYIDGENRGQCGQFAATYVVALRKHGYRCGGICTFDQNSGHARAWIEDRNGKIILTNNKELSNNEKDGIYIYDSYNQLIKSTKDLFKSEYIISGWFLNEKFEVIFDKTIDYQVPIPLEIYNKMR